MRSYDLSPLFRSTVGFDRWSNLFDTALRAGDNGVGYPPYNIEKLGDDSYRITVAVAGFGEDDIEITAQDNLLVVAGKLGGAREDSAAYLYRGIATRAFERRFSLADYVKVTGATLVNGVLTVDLAREVPEAMKPRHIAISTAPADKVIESKKAA
jgi:molecular chaperone IbpA